MFTSLKDFQFPDAPLYNLHDKESGKKWFGYTLTKRHFDKLVFRRYDQSLFCIVIKKWEFPKWEIKPAEEQDYHYWEIPKGEEPKLTKEEQQFTFLPFVEHTRTFEMQYHSRYDLEYKSGLTHYDRELTPTGEYEPGWVFSDPRDNYGNIEITTENQHLWRIRRSKKQLEPEVKELYPFKDFDGFNVFKKGVAYDLRSKVSDEYYERVYLSPGSEGGTFLSAPSRKEMHRTVVHIPFTQIDKWEYRESVLEKPLLEDSDEARFKKGICSNKDLYERFQLALDLLYDIEYSLSNILGIEQRKVKTDGNP